MRQKSSPRKIVNPDNNNNNNNNVASSYSDRLKKFANDEVKKALIEIEEERNKKKQKQRQEKQ